MKQDLAKLHPGSIPGDKFLSRLPATDKPPVDAKPLSKRKSGSGLFLPTQQAR
jgi:hypothetical protein